MWTPFFLLFLPFSDNIGMHFGALFLPSDVAHNDVTTDVIHDVTTSGAGRERIHWCETTAVPLTRDIQAFLDTTKPPNTSRTLSFLTRAFTLHMAGWFVSVFTVQHHRTHQLLLSFQSL